MSTPVPYVDFVNALAKPGSAILASLTPEKCHIWHMASCVPSEGGELFDAVKKYVIYGKDFDLENVLEEAGDILFYLTALLDACGHSLPDAIAHNQRKLAARYASLEYSDEAARARADKSGPARKFFGAEPRVTPAPSENDLARHRARLAELKSTQIPSAPMPPEPMPSVEYFQVSDPDSTDA